jgi:iron complex outermembrane receptor protein
MRTQTFRALAAASVALPAFGGHASGQVAQTTGKSGLEEITITAQKRQENAQKAPLVVTSLSGRTLEAAHVTSAQDLQRVVPDVQVYVGAVAGDPSGARATFAIRGLGNSATSPQGSPGVAVHFDGIYRQDQISNSEFYDLQRIEVDPGPQGTLYGRSAAAGAVNVIPNLPTRQFGGQATIEVGNDGQVRSEGFINLPINDQIAVRGAFQTQNRDGLYSNGYDDLDARSGRLQVLYTPTQDLSIRLYADYAYLGGTGTSNIFVGGPAFPQLTALLPQITNSNLRDDSIAQYCFVQGQLEPACRQRVDDTKYGVHAEIDERLGWGTLTLLPSFHEEHSTTYNANAPLPLSNYDQTPFDDLQTNLEIRMSDPGTTRLKWVLGFGLFHNDTTANISREAVNVLTTLPVFGSGSPAPIGFAPGVVALGPFNNENTQQDSYAAFGQATYPVLDWLRLTGGARFNYDTAAYHGSLGSQSQDIYYVNGPLFVNAQPTPISTGPLSSSTQFRAVTFRAAVDADLTPTSLLYGSVGTGYKPGGLNDGGPASANTAGQLAILGPQLAPPLTPTQLVGYEPRQEFGPEHVAHYEVGTKNRFFDNRLQINDAFFYDDYSGYQNGQTQVVNPLLLRSQGFIVTNVGTARVIGDELSVNFKLTPDDLIGVSANYVQGNFVNYVAKPFLTPSGPAGSLDLSGKDLPDAPHWSGNLSYQHFFNLPGGSQASTSVFTHLTTGYWVYYAEAPGTRQNDYTSTTLDASWTSANTRWVVRGFVNNLEGRTIKTFGNVTSGFTQVALAPPRLYAFSLTRNF